MDPQTNRLNSQDVSDGTPAIMTREAISNETQRRGAVMDFNKSLPAEEDFATGRDRVCEGFDHVGLIAFDLHRWVRLHSVG